MPRKCGARARSARCAGATPASAVRHAAWSTSIFALATGSSSEAIERPAHDGDRGGVRHGGDRRQDSRHRVRVAVAVDVRRRDPRRGERSELRLALAPHLGRVDLSGERAARERVERMEASRRRIGERRRRSRAACPRRDSGAVRRRAGARRARTRSAASAKAGVVTIIDADETRAGRVRLEDPAIHARARSPRSSALMTSRRMRGIYGGI